MTSGPIVLGTCEALVETSATRCSSARCGAMTEAIRKAMRHQSSVDWLLEEEVVHYDYQLGVDGQP